MGFNLDTQATRSTLMSVDSTLSEAITASQDYIPIASTTNFSTSVVAEIETTNEVVSFTDISENIIFYSTQFDNGYWAKTRTTVSADSTTAPDGNTTADTIIESTATGAHNIYRNFSPSLSGTEYTLSVFAKYNGDRHLQLVFGFNDTTGNVFANFDLDNGTIGNKSTEDPNATIEAVGNDWYRCAITGNSLVTSSFAQVVALCEDPATDGRDPSYTGDGSGSIFAWGTQLEPASNMTGFLLTTSAALEGLTGVTRGANGTTAQSASSSDSIQQLPYALSEVNMPTRLKGLSVTSDGTGVGRLTLCDKVGTTLCDVDIPDTRLYELSWDGGIIFPNGIYVANSDNITAYTLYTDKHSGPNLGG